MRKARLYRENVPGAQFHKMWVFDCPCEPRKWHYWHYAAAYGTMLWHFHLYHRSNNG